MTLTAPAARTASDAGDIIGALLYVVKPYVEAVVNQKQRNGSSARRSR